MDPVTTINSLVSVINYLYQVIEKVKENKEECTRLCSHVEVLVKSIQSEYQDDELPPKLDARLKNLSSDLARLTETLQELSKRPFLQRALWRKSISSSIQGAYKDLYDAMEIFRLGSTIDLSKVLHENEQARRRDTERTDNSFERVIGNGKEILQILQVHAGQMQEGMLSIVNHLAGLPRTKSIERTFFERGMHAIQRRSGPLKIRPGEHVITSLDVIIKYDKKLGEGGYAEVYEGDWKGTKVAVKVLQKGIPVSILQQEINVWSRLRHPHILQFYGACSIADPPFMVCAFQANGDIASYLCREPQIDKTKLLHEASLGLTYLHENNIIHGDLKASNILVNECGAPCLSDFGLSRVKAHSTTMRTSQPSNQGTLRWMAPEHIMYGICNKKSDVYSFGMTMYEVFAGSPPFASTPDSVLLTIVCDRGIRPPRPDLEELVDDMWSLIDKCWAQDPSNRPSASQVSDELKQLVETKVDSNPAYEQDSSTDFTHPIPLTRGIPRSLGDEYDSDSGVVDDNDSTASSFMTASSRRSSLDTHELRFSDRISIRPDESSMGPSSSTQVTNSTPPPTSPLPSTPPSPPPFDPKALEPVLDVLQVKATKELERFKARLSRQMQKW